MKKLVNNLNELGELNFQNSEEGQKTENSILFGNEVYYKYLREIKQDTEHDEDYCTAFMTF